MELGQRLRQARLEAGLSQRQLCGDIITRNMLSQIENGTARPSMETLRYLARQLGKPLSFFLEEDAVLSENQMLMTQARQAYADKEYGHTLALLKQYRIPDPVFDAEAALLGLLTLLALAEHAIAEDRLPYAARLLEQAQQAGEATPYFTPELRCKLIFLQAQARPDLLPSLAQRLERDDRALLLRARAALAGKDYSRAAAYLDAAEDREDPNWAFLRGEAAFGMELFAEAAAYYKKAETALPQRVYPRLEHCYLRLEDYKMAYFYANMRKNA
jgi:transcriptional regulator with XRE-family HTH domain